MDPHFIAALRDGAIWYIILVLSIGLHEFGHAKAADMLGDPLPRRQGRVTLNPLAHIDPLGTVLIPLLMIFLPILSGHPLMLQLIGWGKPVQVSLNDPRTRKRDEILITLAGPGMNVVIGVVAAIIGGVAGRLTGHVSDFFYYVIVMNAGLIAFNLIPLPPLDGSRLFRHLVGMSEETFLRLAMNSWWILLILINIQSFRNFLSDLMYYASIPFLYLLGIIAGPGPFNG